MIFEDLIRKKWLRKFGCSVGVYTLSRISQNLTQIYSVCWLISNSERWNLVTWANIVDIFFQNIYLAHYLTLNPVSTNGASCVYFFWSKSNKMPRCEALGKRSIQVWALPIYCYSSQSKECKWCFRKVRYNRHVPSKHKQ